MEETAAEKLSQKWWLVAGGLAVLLLLHRWRQKRKVEKLLKARAKMRARAEKARPEVKGAGKRKRGKKKGKDRSLAEQLLRFAAFQLMKKIISEQIKQMEVDLGRGRIGKKLVEAAEKG